MKLIGDAIRVILNINTIWGLMILTAFGFCVAQHVTPTTTPLDFTDVPSGEIVFALEQVSEDDPKVFTLVQGEWDGASFTATEFTADPASFVTTAVLKPTEQGHALVWDVDQPGEYALLVNGIKLDSEKPIKVINLQSFTNAALDYAKIGFKLALDLVAVMVLMLGLMKVGEAAGIVQLAANALYPVTRLLFPEVPKDHPASSSILMNVTSTLLGLGNAATPFGLKAMEQMQTLNPHKHIASNSQVMFLGINTAGFAMVPTSLIAIRQSAGCANPVEIIGTCMVAGLAAATTAIIMVKALGALPFFTVEAALAEGDAESPPEDQATEDATSEEKEN